ncbi:hypothetical protein [Flavivirga eckloniae]|uniref:Uncharacterized protein n=1 Tax=Flavivirga eckloniae TaxID=1803846 RepID=A0A2K9PJM1_9FLAO|nr:hypothetical protein [Flavivirga eckloniae]AUP77261.1 hypothetical protein C1H87_00420 [Flavivirga eckloniae]
MIIEFIAAPGSGKTYFSNKLYAHLEEAIRGTGVKLFNRADINEIKREKLSTNSKHKTRFKILFSYIKVMDFYLLRSIINLFLFSKYSFKVKSNLSLYLLDIFQNYKIIDGIEKEHNNKCIFILDEGFLHASSICMDECTIENLKNFFKKIKNTKWKNNKQLYVFIDCNTTELYTRLTERDEGWPPNWKHLNPKEKRKVLKKSYSRFKTKRNFISKKKKKKKYYLIDNSEYFSNDELFFEEILKKINKLDKELIDNSKTNMILSLVMSKINENSNIT